MMAQSKRLRYESENVLNTSEDSDAPSQNNDMEEVEMRTYQFQRKPKCFSKNARQARQNRLKKKLYVTRLEKEVDSLKKNNSKLSSIIDNQSYLLSELRNEVRYLKSVLANSSDISKLLRNINHGTGMTASTSLNKALTVSSIPKLEAARKTMHPFEEDEEMKHSEDTDFEYFLNNENDLSQFLLDKTDMPLISDDCYLPTEPLDEHNYTRKPTWLRILEELVISLPMFNLQFQSLRQLHDSPCYQDKYCKNCIVPFSLSFSADNQEWRS